MTLHSGIFHDQDLGWAEDTPFPEPRAGYAAGVLDGKLLIAGGTYWEGSKAHWTKKVFSASTHAFDPETHTWEKLPDAPIPFGYAASTVVDNKLFVLGGFTPSGPNRGILTLSQKLDRYVWERFGEMPEDRMFAKAVSIGDSIYLLGGSAQFEPYDSAGNCCTSRTATNTLMALDTAHPARAWRQLPPYPGAKRWLFAADTDGKSIWMFGGSYQAEREDVAFSFSEVLRYDLGLGRWSAMPSLPDETRGTTPLTALFLEDRFLLISCARKVWQFDLSTLRYKEASPLPKAAFIDKFVYLDGLVIGAGGENSIEGPRKRSEWTFVGRPESDRNGRHR